MPTFRVIAYYTQNVSLTVEADDEEENGQIIRWGEHSNTKPQVGKPAGPQARRLL